MTPEQLAAIAAATERLKGQPRLSAAEKDMRQLAAFSPTEQVHMQENGTAPGMARPGDIEALNAEILRTKSPQVRAVLIEELAKLTRSQAPDAPAGGGSSQPVPATPPDASTKPARAFQRAGGYGPMAAGAAEAVIKGALGAKSLVTDLSDENKAVLAAMREESEADPEGGWRTAGEVGANLVTAAVPGGAAVKAASVFPKFLAPVAAGAAGSGATGLVLNPSEKQGAERVTDKLGMAGKDALLGGAFSGVGSILKKALTKAFTPSAEAVQLFKQGVNPTLQQGAESPVGRFVGGLTSGATSVRERQGHEMADVLLDRVTHGNRSTTGGTGGDYYRSAKDYVSGLYDNVTRGKVFPVSPTTRGEVAAEASKLNKFGQFRDEATEASRIVSNIMGDAVQNKRGQAMNTNVGPDRLRDDLLTPLSRAAHSPSASPELKRRILAARDKLIEKARTQRLTPAEQRLLDEADVLNFDVQRMREATRGAQEKIGIDLKKLVDAYEGNRMAGNTTGDDLIFPAGRVMGRQPNQDQARTGWVNAARIAGGVGLTGGATALLGPLGGAGMAGLYGTSLAGQTAKGARFLMGQNDWQQRLAEHLRRAAPYGAGAGFALTPEE